MAVKDDDLCRPTESLILNSPRRHFRTIVSPIHWQLRSLIGSDKQSNFVYYPSGKGNLQIKRLNTRTCETETVKLLSFSPRCLVVEDGWICCGGESGEFASFQIEPNNHSFPVVADRPGLDPESRAPLDLDFLRANNEALYSYLSRPLGGDSVVASRKTFGKERVNCITIWSQPKHVAPHDGAYTQGVAVLANNDRHVTVVSLGHGDALDVVEYPDAVNRAVISPDGQLLAGISDDPYLYIHQRQLKGSAASTSFHPAERPLYEWKLARRIHLPSQKLADKSDNRGSFAMCFSNTGRYLAVGTQYGAICIFTSIGLTDEEQDPLLTSFSSSRPRSETGAVRVLAFCPGPFDLLAWTEDRGRVGVVDARGDFLSRQILSLDQHSEYEHLEIADSSSIDPRLLDSRNERDSLASTLASSLDLSSEGRGLVRSDNLDRYNYPFSSDDTVVLEALQDHRRRREQRAAAAQMQMQMQMQSRPPLDVDVGAAGSRLNIPELAEPSRGSRQRSASVSRAFSDILTNIRDQRDRLRETQERLRAQTRDDLEAESRRPVPQPTPRRLGAAETDALPPRRALVSRLMGNPSQAQAQGDPPAASGASGWSEIEALYQLAYEGSPYDATRFHDGDLRRRDRAAIIGSLFRRAQGDWESNATRRALGHYYAANRETTPEMDETAGLAWSADGRILYVGAEDGIYELHVAVFNRKLSPSLTMR